jgi:hypothetical protein
MAHKIYLIRQLANSAQGICVFEKRNTIELTKFLNEHYATEVQRDNLFKGSIKALNETGVIFDMEHQVVHTTATVNENMDHGQFILFDFMVICKNNKWTAYRQSSGCGHMVEMTEEK